VSVAHNDHVLHIRTTYTIDASCHWLFPSHQNFSEFLEHHGNIVIYSSEEHSTQCCKGVLLV